MIVRQGGLSASPGSAVAKQGSLFDYFFICLEWKFIIHCCSDSDYMPFKDSNVSV